MITTSPSIRPLESRSPLARWLPVTAMIAFSISALPLLAWYGKRITDGSDEPLGVIALLVALVTLAFAARYGKRDGITIFPGRMIVGAALLSIFQVGGVLRYPLLIGLLAIAILAFSIRMPRGKAGTIALLVLSLPLIASLDFYAGYPLRLIAAEITTLLLKLGGIPVEKSGVMLIDGDRLVGIDPPCAGIRMLWTSCFVAAVLSARMRLSWLRTLVLLSLAFACVVVGNGVRAALVFFPESGRVAWPEWAHPGVGLLVHGSVLFAVFHFASRLDRAGKRWECHKWWQGTRRVAILAIGLILMTSVIFFMNRGHERPQQVDTAWPTMLEGVALIRQPLSPMEQSFARAFPGDMAKFTWGDAEIIMRRTDQATRMMHPSGDCLRAAGFETHSKPVYRDADGLLWGASLALRNGSRWTVHERYVAENGEASTDASAWYWQALMNPKDGPWTAMTVIRPD